MSSAGDPHSCAITTEVLLFTRDVSAAWIAVRWPSVLKHGDFPWQSVKLPEGLHENSIPICRKPIDFDHVWPMATELHLLSSHPCAQPTGASWRQLAAGHGWSGKKNRWLVEIPRFSPASGGELQQMAQSPRSLNLSGGLPHFRPLFGELGCTKVDERNPAPRCKWNPEWVVDSFWMFLIFGWSKNGAYPINPHFWQ